MGALYRFDLQPFKDLYNLKNYVETGTGEGVCLEHALKTKFDQYISIEAYPKVYDKVKSKFYGIQLCLGYSKDVLPQILPNLEGNTLFFLDAHFPGADFHFESYFNDGEDSIRLPLETELKLIKEYRKGYNDVIIIDDLRIYRDGPFEGGNWEHRAKAGKNDDKFIFDLLEQMNKKVSINYMDQGYVIAEPR